MHRRVHGGGVSTADYDKGLAGNRGAFLIVVLMSAFDPFRTLVGRIRSSVTLRIQVKKK
jgi:hypothetical protein